MKNLLQPLTKSVLIQLGLTAATSVTDIKKSFAQQQQL